MKEESKEIYKTIEKRLTCIECGIIMTILCDSPIDKDDYTLCSICKDKKAS